MEWERLLERLLPLSVAGMIFMAGAIYFMPPDQASYFELYEMLGATMASTITIFGLLKMKQMTSK